MTDSASQEPDPELLELWARVFEFARQGRTETLIAYVDAGLSPNLTNDKGDTLAMWASYYGHADTAQDLVERGADRNRINGRGQSLIDRTVLNNRPAHEHALGGGSAARAVDQTCTRS